MNAYIRFRSDTGFEPIDIEIPLYHPRYIYCGKPDVRGHLNGKIALIDKKSGQKAKVDPLQGAAYWELERVNKRPVDKVFDLYLDVDGTYKLEPINNPKGLLPIFLSILKAAQWKENL